MKTKEDFIDSTFKYMKTEKDIIESITVNMQSRKDKIRTISAYIKTRKSLYESPHLTRIHGLRSLLHNSGWHRTLKHVCLLYKIKCKYQKIGRFLT